MPSLAYTRKAGRQVLADERLHRPCNDVAQSEHGLHFMATDISNPTGLRLQVCSAYFTLKLEGRGRALHVLAAGSGCPPFWHRLSQCEGTKSSLQSLQNSRAFGRTISHDNGASVVHTELPGR